MMSKPPKKLERRTLAAVAASACMDLDAATRHVQYIVDKWGRKGLYCACAGWAETFRLLTIGTTTAESGYGFRVTMDGRPVDPDSVDADGQGAVWAFRFMSAVANRDEGMAFALFTADDDAMLDGAMTVLALAGQATAEAGSR